MLVDADDVDAFVVQIFYYTSKATFFLLFVQASNKSFDYVNREIYVEKKIRVRNSNKQSGLKGEVNECKQIR